MSAAIGILGGSCLSLAIAIFFLIRLHGRQEQAIRELAQTFESGAVIGCCERVDSILTNH